MDTDLFKQLKSAFPVVVFDLETTGLSNFHDEIIEIAAVRYEKGEVIDRLSLFVKPEKTVPTFIYKLTNITPEQLAGGISCKKALAQFFDFIKPSDVLVAHNAPFDIGFINAKSTLQKRDKIYNKVYDTCDFGRIFLPFLTNFKLQTMIEHFGIDNEGAHRAIHDTEVTGKLFYKLIELIVDQIPIETLNFLLKVADFALPLSGLQDFLSEIRNFTLKHSLLNKKSSKNKILFKNRNYIDHNEQNYQTYEINDIFEKNGLLNKNFSNYEVREGQIVMANSVLDAFNKDDFLLVEAGTGVGKSLAYLIPAIQFGFIHGKKVIVSTNTKNLQEQLLFKDLPLIQEVVNTPFSAVLVKGRENYMCRRKWKEIFHEFTINAQVQSFSPVEAIGLLYLAVWANFTETGDISENSAFEGSDYNFIWKRVSSDRHLCSGKKCSENGQCHLQNIKYKTEKANIVVVNHSLLFSDFMNENASLGVVDYLIIDEAHNLLNSASQHLGMSISYPDLNGFIHSLFSTGKKYQNGLLVTFKTMAMKSIIVDSKKENFVRLIDDMINTIEEENSCLEDLFRYVYEVATASNNYGKLRIKDVNKYPEYKLKIDPIISYLSSLMEKLELIINSMKGFSSDRFNDYDNQLTIIEGISERIFEFILNLKKLQNPDTDENTLWFSTMNVKDENYPAGIINFAPIEVNKILPDLIFTKVKSIIFASATMAIRGSFKYFISNLGLDLMKDKIINQQIVESPFDYHQQALVLNTTYLPNNSDPYFSPQSIDLLKNIIEKNRVGSMVLFTSYKDLNQTYETLSDTCYKNDILLLAQGKTGSRSSMLSDFKKQGNAVLLGTSSFWEGVDVQGESLSLLVLYKLPFQVPTDPIVEAYIEKLEKENKNSFMHYSLPNALLKMRQGFGRLIRSKSDHGIILILDNRIKSKYYGKYFEEILPTKIHYMDNPEQTLTNIAKWFRKI